MGNFIYLIDYVAGAPPVSAERLSKARGGYVFNVYQTSIQSLL